MIAHILPPSVGKHGAVIVFTLILLHVLQLLLRGSLFSHALQLLIDDRQQLVIFLGVATKVDGHGATLGGIFPELSVHAHTIGATLLLAHGLGVYGTHDLREHVELKVIVGGVRHIGGVEHVGERRRGLQRLVEHRCTLSALNVESILSRLVVCLMTLLCLLARQACHILAEEIFKQVLTNVARDDEIHALKVGETLMIDLVHAVEAHLVKTFCRDRLRALAVSIDSHAQRVVIGYVRTGVTVLQHRPLLGNQVLEDGLVLARLGEVEIHHLKPGLKVGSHTHALHALFLRVDVRHHAQRLATAFLLKGEVVEIGSATLAHHAAQELQSGGVAVGVERAATQTEHVYRQAVRLYI